MAGVNLLADEKELQEKVKKNLDLIMDDIHSNKLDYEQRKQMFDEMAKAAHELHMKLKGRGLEPIHHGYMIKNRGMDATHPQFYWHVHPAQDLLKYIDDVDANKDPEDQTIGNTFYFEVFTRRWGHKDKYEMTRTEKGWDIKALSRNGSCNRDGSPVLFESLTNDLVNYPEALGGYIEWVWERAKEDGLDHSEVQEALNQLADWVSLTESHSPKGIFEGYK